MAQKIYIQVRNQYGIIIGWSGEPKGEDTFRLVSDIRQAESWRSDMYYKLQDGRSVSGMNAASERANEIAQERPHFRAELVTLYQA